MEEFLKFFNKEKSDKMSKYMRNQFEFIGIPTPFRRKIEKLEKTKFIDWSFVKKLWDNKYREMQYYALDYLSKNKKFLQYKDINNLIYLIENKSWWDTIDYISSIIGYISFEYKEVDNLMMIWSKNDNFWFRRISIIYQLKRKEKTDLYVLENNILNNIDSKEFFINKAIGWSLREYSKTDRNWVKNFINKNNLSSLSVKEASKYLK